jgi:hypothetical protein
MVKFCLRESNLFGEAIFYAWVGSPDGQARVAGKGNSGARGNALRRLRCV